MLGDLPPPDHPVSANLLGRTEENGYLLERIELDLNGCEPVPAYFVLPLGSSQPLPCLLYHHAHGGNYTLGKDELIRGRSSLQMPPFAEALTSRGYAAFCIDTWCFGQRGKQSESETFKEMLWKGQVLWGMMIYDSLRSIDYLVSRPEVDSRRIGTIGLSMGSTLAWWTAALDTRIRACVDICCLTDFHALIAERGLDRHGLYYFVPSLLKHFDTAAINALIAPRPHLSLAGDEDPLTPSAGLDRIDRDLRKAYAEAGAPDAWKLLRYDTGHHETEDMRREILTFLEKCL